MTMENLNTNSGVSKIELSKTQIGVGAGLVALISAVIAWFFTKRVAEEKAAEVAKVNNQAISALERRLELMEKSAQAQAAAQAQTAVPAVERLVEAMEKAAQAQTAAPAAAQAAAPAPQATVAAVNTALAR